ncbi:hydroxysqualene dehydroxylase HpnE [Curvibacter sp. CHRR-16]|nr:hydroxysqualene dehydroxylase HpnE [Curvibacter sp. CHRR-16]
MAIIGAGWAGLACAVQLAQRGHSVQVFEAARTPGGRARTVQLHLPDGNPVDVDNGQHILIGAYRDSLALMQQVGVDVQQALLRTAMDLRTPDGHGLCLPHWPRPWNALPQQAHVLAGLLGCRGWTLGDKLALLRASLRWQWMGFTCPPTQTVAELCCDLPAAVQSSLIEPLCVSALNTPMVQASASVFLRVLQDALFGGRGGADLLLPRVPLGQLLAEPACHWLQTQGHHVYLGQRIGSLRMADGDAGWQLLQPSGQPIAPPDGHDYWPHVALATSAANSAAMLAACAQAATKTIANTLHAWQQQAAALQYLPIATVYTWSAHSHLPRPMVALPALQAVPTDSAGTVPAQFVFDRGQLGGPAGLLAWVVSACGPDAAATEALVLQQASTLLGHQPQVLQTIVEKRATFACTPALKRPSSRIAPGLWAVGDYVEGPYPATLEGAVRCGFELANSL